MFWNTDAVVLTWPSVGALLFGFSVAIVRGIRPLLAGPPAGLPGVLRNNPMNLVASQAVGSRQADDERIRSCPPESIRNPNPRTASFSGNDSMMTQ